MLATRVHATTTMEDALGVGGQGHLGDGLEQGLHGLGCGERLLPERLPRQRVPVSEGESVGSLRGCCASHHLAKVTPFATPSAGFGPLQAIFCVGKRRSLRLAGQRCAI